MDSRLKIIVALWLLSLAMTGAVIGSLLIS
jgi:hypothetical protein